MMNSSGMLNKAKFHWIFFVNYSLLHIDGLVQERSNSSANTLELRLSYTKPLICTTVKFITQTMLFSAD